MRRKSRRDRRVSALSPATLPGAPKRKAQNAGLSERCRGGAEGAPSVFRTWPNPSNGSREGEGTLPDGTGGTAVFPGNTSTVPSLARATS